MSLMFKLKLLVVILFAAAVIAALFTNNAANRSVHAFSSGPPAGYTRAPGEEPEACAECHVVSNSGTGQLTLNVPRTYSPGQSYNITVTHANADQTRMRWGFQLTALDPGDDKAGTLEPLDNLTQTLSGQGPFPERQYIEHTSQGTFLGQRNGASWTFRWTAPASDVGPVTFYVAGNQANGDGNTSGDNIYFTFAPSTFAPPAPDFNISVTPSSRTVTPIAGFTGVVNLFAGGQPAGANVSFASTSLAITDANAKTTTMLVSADATTPLSTHTLNVRGESGALQHTTSYNLVVASPASADLSLIMTDSPDPAIVGTTLSYRIEATNNGPAAATGVTISDTLPTSINFISATPSQGACSGTTSVNCALGGLAVGASAVVTINAQPQGVGSLSNTAIISAAQSDPIPANNTATINTTVVAASSGPSMLVSNLGVRAIVAGLNQPTSMAFIGPNDFLVLEKETGKVQRVTNGVARGAVLDLAVNSASERGLLGIALHPNFAGNGFVYLYWTESLTGADTTAIDAVPLLGNRVDRFVWNGSTLTLNQNVIRLRALQMDAGQPSRGNHNGGVIRFGPDGKLYIIIGDNGRRGLLQNITSGGPVPDDQFGGPEPDDAHLTGVILRLNDDGSTPTDNPFFNANTGLTGQAALNVKKIFAYGVRNSFGMDFDPVGGALWTQENGDDAFDEINRVGAGFNGGWIQLMGPSSRVAEFKQIEVTRGNSLQQNRWPPTNLADTPAQALARLYTLPGSTYTEPKFSWKYAVAPSPIGFARGAGLGAQYANDLFVGASRTTLLGGYLFRFDLSPDRSSIQNDDARLSDLVADNADKFDLGESESLLVGRDFGITTDIQTGPNGKLYVVSLSNGAVYEIFARKTLFVANLDGSQETPSNATNAKGTATILLNEDETSALVSLRFRNLTGEQTMAHIHGPASAGQSAPPIFDLPNGNFTDFQITLTPAQVADLKAGKFYANVHSASFPAGEIRGQFGVVAQSSIVQLDVDNQEIPESAQLKTLNVIRLGDTLSAATVDYATSDGTATERADYTTARGTLRFAPGETQKSFNVLITDDVYTEPAEGLVATLTNPTGAAVLNVPASVALAIVDNDAAPPVGNPVDDTAFFVRQHYHDFLNREPDAAGLQFWMNEIESCAANAQCREAKHVNVSAAFFLSIEFQETGYLVYRLYDAAFDRQPRYLEFVPDTQEIGSGVVVGQGNWQAQLEANKQTFANLFTQRAAFKLAFDSVSNAQYVDKLFMNAGVTPTATERDALINGLTNGAETRSAVLLKVADNAQLRALEFNRAFVLMQYFGYLRRNPDDAPDTNFSGYNFWLAKLKQFNGNFAEAEMVKAFISSTEYRKRFGP
jgi:uncharacterized repeat protein (TIGR01451 family)